MISDEKRREVAENLRYLTIGHSIHYKEQFFDELAEVVVGFEDYHDFDTVLDKLADLIDMPDNPTCRNLSNDYRSFHCSRCGYKAFTYCDSDCDPEDFAYCPECRAEVVEDD